MQLSNVGKDCNCPSKVYSLLIVVLQEKLFLLEKTDKRANYWPARANPVRDWCDQMMVERTQWLLLRVIRAVGWAPVGKSVVQPWPTCAGNVLLPKRCPPPPPPPPPPTTTPACTVCVTTVGEIMQWNRGQEKGHKLTDKGRTDVWWPRTALLSPIEAIEVLKTYKIQKPLCNFVLRLCHPAIM